MQIETKKQAMSFLKEFMDEVRTQECRYTARPFYYVIRSAEWRVASEFDETERYTWVSKDGDYEDTVTALDLQGAIKAFREDRMESYLDYEDSEETNMSDEDIEEVLNSKYDEYPECKNWVDHKLFFTESAAENYLKRNAYHFSPDAHTYLKYAGDVGEIYKLFAALNVITDEALNDAD